MIRSLFVAALVAGLAAAQQPPGQADAKGKAAQERPQAKSAAAVIPPTAADYRYGPHARNTFDFCFHPVTGGCFGSENGPTSQDEVNYIQKGKNFEWQTLPPRTKRCQRSCGPKTPGHSRGRWVA